MILCKSIQREIISMNDEEQKDASNPEDGRTPYEQET